MINIFIKEIKLIKEVNKKHNTNGINYITINDYINANDNLLLIEDLRIIKRIKKKHFLNGVGSVVLFAVIVAITGILTSA